MSFTVDSAKEFLLSKLSTQAAHDGVPLDEVERKMFLFSEISGDVDLEAQKLFDSEYDETAYESKIAKLLHRAYAADKETSNQRQEWQDALGRLSNEDFYGLGMVDQAGIPRRKDSFKHEMWQFGLESLPFAIVELLVMALGFLIVFRPSVLGLNLPDWIRWLAFPLFIWLLWYGGRVWNRMQMDKAVEESKARQR